MSLNYSPPFSVRRTAIVSSGFTLIEVLIAIVVLSFGMLAIAALQFRTIESSQTSNGRGIAASMASSLAEEMLSNRAQLTSLAYNRTVANMPATPVAACFTTAGCSAADLVTTNLAAWNNNLASLLGPGAGGLVCIDSTPDGNTTTSATAPVCDNAPGAPYVIYVWRHDNRNNSLAASSPYQRFSVSVQP